ncbi:cytochrome c oxidase assembly factor Coa1 family protein [Tenacibaculum sp. M341]|uniref:cytochrome c oxidase assembly factor Coa1 family protein n=1 Tax=Tenacibaculum sp. M341 TaxID=2530339 RepID=UPI0010456225|nr:cytochrome c oxidase assembly factor Coa1 family protein [Tenacibaculum sp. M341]TCI93084.1 hypothetical protein EYW44_05555 [Tenacibaculum sp. M341]
MENRNEKSWIGKNWPWLLPVGCCSGCLIMILVFVFGVGTAAFGIFNALVDSSPMEDAVILASNNEKVVEYLGDDIESSGFPNGEISINNDDGHVDFSIGIHGTKGEGVLVVKGIRVDKKWVYEDLYVTIKETGEEINLLNNNTVYE